ncbi:hypothetical protein FACS1894123_02710 [Bacteroidia bacterium]|nr:hypothetical protein FACS1894123_02710 [Bacteroidia bacterium]
MKPSILILFLHLAFVFSTKAQDLVGFQKLRGEVISSEPEDAYSAHAYNAFDTNKGTSFKAKNLNGWVGLDLKSSYSVKKIRIYPRADRRERLVGSIFQGANDPSFANPINLTQITQIPPANQYTTYNVQLNRTFRYVRCLSPNQNCNPAELEFYTNEGEQTLEYPQLTNLPTIYLETKGGFNFVEKVEYVASKVLVSDGSVVNSYDAGVRGRGNSTWDFMDKKSFRIKFDKKQHFLGLPASAKNWVLIACAVDKTFVRNGLAFEISKTLGFEYTPPCVYVDVVLDGFYYGTYFVSDHIDVDKKRIDIDEMTPSDIQPPKISGGYHLEIDAYANLEKVYFYTNRGVPFSIKSPDSDEILPIQKAWIQNHINQLEAMLYSDPEQACEKYIDIESAVKYYLLSELTGNCDSYWCIPAFKKRGDDKLYFGPVWDYDQAFLTNERVPRFAATLDTQHGVAQQWFRIIMQTNAAKKVLSRLWKEVMAANLKQQLLTYADENAALLQQSQALNYQRWNSLNRKVWFEDALFNTYNEYITFVKGFINDRINWFDEICSTEKYYFLSPSTSKNLLKTWKYTTSGQGNQNWFTESFNDSGWLSGQAPFGTEQNLQNTLWNGSQIYIRTQFDVKQSDLDAVEKLYLTLFHDEDCWVYINGQLALNRSGYITSYQSFEIDKNLLKPSGNTIAIRCIQTTGGQLIDAGIYGTMKRQDTGIKKTMPSKYSYTVSGNVLTLNTVEANIPVAVYSLDGRLLIQQKTSSPSTSIRLLHKGIYLVRMPDETFSFLSK